LSDVRLAHLFDLEPLEQGLYRGDSWDLGFRALYGGQVLGQSVMAAYHTVPEGRVIHSFHSYFLLPGDATKPVVYDIENVRDGRSFSTRRVKAIQNGRNIFYMTASFQLPEQGLSHQYANMPEAPDPKDVSQDIQYYDDNFDKLSGRMKQALSYHRPTRTIWLKGRDPLEDSLAVNQASLAYASDYHFLSTALQAHGLAAQDKSLRMATIDHAMWFHQPFRFDDWLLYQMESPFSGNARALVQGKIYDKSGTLIATSIQEGLMRQVKD